MYYSFKLSEIYYFKIFFILFYESSGLLECLHFYIVNTVVLILIQVAGHLEMQMLIMKIMTYLKEMHNLELKQI